MRRLEYFSIIRKAAPVEVSRRISSPVAARLEREERPERSTHHSLAALTALRATMQATLQSTKSRRPTGTLSAGAFLGDGQVIRSHPGWRAYRATYPPRFECGRHDHEQAALCIVSTGVYEERGGRGWADLSPGAVVQQPAGNHHADRHGDEIVELLIVEFESDYLAHLHQIAPVLGERQVFIGRDAAAFGIRFRREILTSDAASGLACDSLLLDFLARSLRLAKPVESDRPAWWERVNERIRNLKMAPATLAELAAEAGIHPMHLTRVFRRHAGVSVGTYRRQIMVQEARRQIEETDFDLTTIAHSIGFSDQSHMSRLFKIAFGCSPSDYRRMRHT